MKQVIFLVGGRGTRLGTLSERTPKPLLPVAGRPFLSYLIDKSLRHGLDDIVLLAGHRSEEVQRLAEAVLSSHGLRVSVVIEPSPAGTAGALLGVRDRLDDRFLLVNGDTLFDFDWRELTTMDTTDDWVARIALRSIADASRYSRVELAGTLITAFATDVKPGPGLINGGVYLLRRAIIDHVNHVPLSMEHDIFPRLVREARLHGRAYDGYFVDIGVPDDFARAQIEFPP